MDGGGVKYKGQMLLKHLLWGLLGHALSSLVGLLCGDWLTL